MVIASGRFGVGSGYCITRRPREGGGRWRLIPAPPRKTTAAPAFAGATAVIGRNPPSAHTNVRRRLRQSSVTHRAVSTRVRKRTTSTRLLLLTAKKPRSFDTSLTSPRYTTGSPDCTGRSEG